MRQIFGNFARTISRVMGSPIAFLIAFLIVVGWGIAGPVFNYSNTWQLFINTLTTVVTFLMVILLQHAQNHDARAVHLKLDELIRAVKSARNSLLDLEAMTDDELEALRGEFLLLRDESISKDSHNRHKSA